MHVFFNWHFSNGKSGNGHKHNNYRFGRYASQKTWDRTPFPFEPKPRFEVFPTLNTTYGKVLVNEASIIPKPLAKRPTNKHSPNNGVFRRFHQFNGHNTGSYITLRNIIKSLNWEGKFEKYVNTKPPHRRQINMISAISVEPTLASTSQRSLKHYVCYSFFVLFYLNILIYCFLTAKIHQVSSL